MGGGGGCGRGGRKGGSGAVATAVAGGYESGGWRLWDRPGRVQRRVCGGGGMPTSVTWDEGVPRAPHPRAHRPRGMRVWGRAALGHQPNGFGEGGWAPSGSDCFGTGDGGKWAAATA